MPDPALAHLVSAVRALVGGAGASFTDAEIEEAIRRRLEEHRGLPLYKVVLPDGSAAWYEAGAPDWAADGRFWAGRWVTPAEADWVAGRFRFDPDPGAVLLYGRRADIHLVAADLLDRAAARIAADPDVSVADVRLDRGEIVRRLRDLADHYRSLAWRSGDLMRGDMA